MLVLKRDVGERVIIGDGLVVVEVTETGYGWVRLGFTADPSLVIDREEIHFKKKGLIDEQVVNREGGSGDPEGVANDAPAAGVA